MKMGRQSDAAEKWQRGIIAAIVFSLAVVPALAASAQSQLTADDIAAADANRRAVSADLEAVTIEYDTAVARLIELENSLTTLGIELAELERDLATAKVAAQEVATDRYVYSGSSQSAVMGAASIDDVSIRTSYLDILSRVGTDKVLRLFGLEESYQAQEIILANALTDQQQTSADLEVMAAGILTRLEEANALFE